MFMTILGYTFIGFCGIVLLWDAIRKRKHLKKPTTTPTSKHKPSVKITIEHQPRTSMRIPKTHIGRPRTHIRKPRETDLGGGVVQSGSRRHIRLY